MSRLVFCEEAPLERPYREESERQASPFVDLTSVNTSVSGTVTLSSVSSASSVAEEKKAKKKEKKAKKKEKKDEDQVIDLVEEEDEEDVSENQPQDSSSTKKKKNKKKKKKTDTTANSHSELPVTSTPKVDTSGIPTVATFSADMVNLTRPSVESKPVQVSGWLNRFLSVDRVYTVEEAPPMDLVNEETFLREFHESLVERGDVAEPLSSDESVDDASSIEAENSSSYEEGEEEEDSDDEVYEGIKRHSAKDALVNGAAPNGATLVKVNLFNLPYAADREDIFEFVRSHQLLPTTIVLGSAGNRGLPQGSACVELALKDKQTVDQAVNILVGKSFNGRPIRAQKVGAVDNSRRAQNRSHDSGRYFEEEVIVKCLNCGIVGHKQTECPLPPPCHFCGSREHDAGGCVNIICFRCNGLGHHSRDCMGNGGGRPRSQLCFLCESTMHDAVRCPEYGHPLSNDCDSLLLQPSLLCIDCGKLGHSSCKLLPSMDSEEEKHQKSSSTLPPMHCPNCALQGHHIEYPTDPKDSEAKKRYCDIPRAEAFQKFPQLLDHLEELHVRPEQFYSAMIRNPRDRNLFPFLCPPAVLSRVSAATLATIDAEANQYSARNSRKRGHDDDEYYAPPQHARRVILNEDMYNDSYSAPPRNYGRQPAYNHGYDDHGSQQYAPPPPSYGQRRVMVSDRPPPPPSQQYYDKPGPFRRGHPSDHRGAPPPPAYPPHNGGRGAGRGRGGYGRGGYSGRGGGGDRYY